MNEVTMYGRWFGLMARLGVPIARLKDALKFFEALHHAYSSRAYHNLRHVKMCLDELDGFRNWHNEYWDCGVSFDEVELALWWHDFINNNEELSAEHASESLKSLSLNHMSKTVSELIKVGTDYKNIDILNKKHSRAERVDPDGVDLIRDIDLTILGQKKEIFNDYENNVRQEYVDVPSNVFREKRADILQGFLDRPRIYMTTYFHDKYENPARENIKRSIARLTS